MMKSSTTLCKKFIPIFFVAILLFVSLTNVGFAQDRLVPCGYVDGPACTPCHIIVLVIRLINYFVIYLATPVALLAFTYSGFVFATAGGSESRVKAGKKILTNAVIGLLIIYGAFFLVDTVIKVATGGLNNFVNNAGPWNQPTITINGVTCTSPEDTSKPTGSIEQSTSMLVTAITDIANSIGTILMAVAVMMVMYSAYLFVTGGGNEKQITSARSILVYGVIGVAVALLAFTIPYVTAYIAGG